MPRRGLTIALAVVVAAGVFTTDDTSTAATRCFHRPLTYLGTTGPDVHLGFSDRDVMRGRAGDDGLFGLDGRDRLCGGGGGDQLVGGNGWDRVNGGAGFDSCDAEYMVNCEQVMTAFPW